MTSRRNFIKTTTAAGIAFVAGGAGLSVTRMNTNASDARIHVFTKCLQFLDYDKMAEVLARQGFYGADLTVRPRGQVLPENVETDLPKAVKALRNAGIDSNMIVTSITDADDPFTRPILKTMAELGIQNYRMGYFNYDDKLSIPDNLDRHKFTFEKLENINRDYGVHGDYQNHSGRRVGGPVWDLYHLLKDRDPEFTGVQYDVRHATVEGGVSWPLGMKLLAPWIRTTAIKDFIWEKKENNRWGLLNVPLGEGMVDFESYLKLYKELQIKGPVTIHYEYDMGGAERGKQDPSIAHEKIYSYLLTDLNFLKGQFDQYL